MTVKATGDLPPTRGVGAALGASIDRALGRIRRSSGIELAFGGPVETDGVRLDHFDGPVIGPLRGVHLALGHGLGGRVVDQRRPLALPDYVGTTLISHRYDRIIRAERLRAFAAVPVIVGRTPVAVLYASQRTAEQHLDRVLDVVAAEAKVLEQEIAIIAAVRGAQDLRSEAAPVLERVRDAHGQLLALARGLDADLAASLRAIADDMVSAGPPGLGAVHITPRERDVLTLLAAGLSDRATSTALGIGLHTVKSHVKSLLGKLQASNRHEVVVHARKHDLLP